MEEDKEKAEKGTLWGYPIVHARLLDGLADDDLKITFGGPLVQTEVEELREKIAFALDGIANGYSTDYIRSVLKDTPR